VEYSFLEKSRAKKQDLDNPAHKAGFRKFRAQNIIQEQGSARG